MNKILTLFLLIVLAGCAAQPKVTSVNILDEVSAIKQHLGCEWHVYPDPLFPAKGHDYACVMDRFNSVMLYLEPSDEILDNGAPAIEKITLIWKEWHEDAHIVNGRIPASQSIAYVAQRLFPEHMHLKVVEAFLGRKKENFSYNQLRARYRYENKHTLNLHQLDIYNGDRHKRLFVFDPPHSYQPSKKETTDSSIPLEPVPLEKTKENHNKKDK